MDIINHAKNIGSVLATAASLAYISGYLILRARSNALGTDPAFTLVDEAYVFAGVRFIFITLIVVLCLSPILILVGAGVQWVNGHLPSLWTNLIQWILLAVLASIALTSLKILNVSGVLLQQGVTNHNTNLVGAIMGTQTAYGLFLTFGMVFLAILSAYWLKMRITTGFDAFTWILCIVVALLFFMLPIYHGALLADRKVRLLAGVPDVVTGIYEPVGILDHTKEHYTLFGRDDKGDPCLTTIKQDDLYGIPIKKIFSLKVFMDMLAQNPSSTGSTSTIQKNQEKNMSSNESDALKSFFKTLIDELHMVFESIASLGDGIEQAGELWSVQIDTAGMPSEPKRLGTMSDLSWPIASPDGKTIYALQDNKVVKLINNFNETEVINKSATWIKLLGMAKNGAILGLIYMDNQTRPAIISNTGDLQISPSAHSTEDQAQLSRLLQESRSYTDDRALYVDRSERGSRGFDVYFQSGSRSINVSDCGDDICSQASISPDFQLVLFIRQQRF